MSAEPHLPDTRSEDLPEEPADLAADLEADRRRERELEEAELAGEA